MPHDNTAGHGKSTLQCQHFLKKEYGLPCERWSDSLAESEWVLLNGQPVDFKGTFALMDQKLRSQLQTELAPCSTQVFMDAYAAAHRAKFGEDFSVMTSPSR